MQLYIPDIILLSLILRLAKRPANINPPPREISSGEDFGITNWFKAWNLSADSEGGRLLIGFSLDK